MLEKLNSFGSDTLIECLGMEITHVEDGSMKAKMPVDNRTKQPAGILSGGASLALAETLGGFLSYTGVDQKVEQVLGVSISANHFRTVSEGYVYAVAKYVHKGRKTHVIDIEIFDDNDRLISSSRLTNMIVPIKQL